MAITGELIREYNIIAPHYPRTQSPEGLSFGESLIGYDVRLAQSLVIPPQGFVLGSILEHMVVPLDLVGVVHDKSTNARLGITLQNTVIEPGWEGYLTVEITNHLPNRWWSRYQNTYVLPSGYPIAQVLFHRVEGKLQKGYDGKYQHQLPEPVPAIRLLPKF